MWEVGWLLEMKDVLTALNYTRSHQVTRSGYVPSSEESLDRLAHSFPAEIGSMPFQLLYPDRCFGQTLVLPL